MKRHKSLIMPKGFRASGVASGIKDGNKLDLGLIISDLVSKNSFIRSIDASALCTKEVTQPTDATGQVSILT